MQTLEFSGGDLGWAPWNLAKNVTNAVGRAAASSANAVADGAKAAARKSAEIAEDAARISCKISQNPLVQAGAGIATTVGGIGPTGTIALKAASAACSAAMPALAAREAARNASPRGTAVSHQTGPTALTPATAKPIIAAQKAALTAKTAKTIAAKLPTPVVMVAPATATTPALIVPAYPAGTIHAFTKTGRLRVAIPKGSAINGADFGDAAYTEVTAPDAPPSNSTQTTEKDLLNKTGQTPIYKKWWFWTAIGVAAAGATGTVIYIRRRK